MELTNSRRHGIGEPGECVQMSVGWLCICEALAVQGHTSRQSERTVVWIMRVLAEVEDEPLALAEGETNASDDQGST